MTESDAYWAVKPSAEVVKACIERIRRYREHLRVTGRTDKMRRAYSCYRGQGPRGDTDGSRQNAGGESGEMLHSTVNHFAALVNQAVVLTTANKPATKAVPSNTDYESLAQAQFAEAINDYYDRELGISDREDEATLTMVLMGETAIVGEWDATVGEPYMDGAQPDAEVQNAKVITTGEPRLYSLTPFDFAVDPDVANVDSHTWILWRRKANRFDLGASFPSAKEALSANNGRDVTLGVFDTRDEASELTRRRSVHSDTDDVWVWELRHKGTPACPNGRMLRFVNEDVVLFDSVQQTPEGPADYGSVYLKELFVWFASPERLPGTNEPHTAFFDLLSLQEGVDLCASIMASAINSGGLQNLYVPRGANVTATKLTGSLNVIEYDGQTIPKAEANVAIPPEVAAWAELCITWMRQRVSLNDVVVGEPSKGMPAQAMALLRAQAVEFHSRLQKAYEKMIQKVRTGVLHLLQRFATMERMVLVAGKSNSWAAQTFKSDDVSKVARFVVEPINPVMKTLAGKVGFAQALLDTGRISIHEYLQVLQTGRLEPILRGEQDNLSRIQSEKELLMKGIGLPPVAMPPPGAPPPMPGELPVFVSDGQQHISPLISDTHWLDIPEALSVLSMPTTRSNEAVVKAVTDYVTCKLAMWRQQDPAITMLLKGQPAPPPGMPLGMAPPGMPPPQGAPGGAPPPMGQPQGAGPQLPKPPPNPITQQSDMQTQLQPSTPQGV